MKLLKEVADEIGMNIDEVLNRFAQNPSLLKKFVKKFPNDKTFQNLSVALKNRDSQEVEVCAHTLKGVAGNLGFSKLYDRCSDLGTVVKEDNDHLLYNAFDDLQEEYEKVLETISKIHD